MVRFSVSSAFFEVRAAAPPCSELAFAEPDDPSGFQEPRRPSDFACSGAAEGLVQAPDLDMTALLPQRITAYALRLPRLICPPSSGGPRLQL